MPAAQTTLRVHFVSESAGYRNAFGWYDKATGYGGVPFGDIEANGGHPTVVPGASSEEFTVPPPVATVPHSRQQENDASGKGNLRPSESGIDRLLASSPAIRSRRDRHRKRRRRSMHTMRTLIRSGQMAPARHFVSILLSRALQPVRLIVEELHRSFAAARRYEELRTRRGAGSPLRGRGSKARQVFVEIYADAEIKAPCGAATEHA